MPVSVFFIFMFINTNQILYVVIHKRAQTTREMRCLGLRTYPLPRSPLSESTSRQLVQYFLMNKNLVCYDSYEVRLKLKTRKVGLE